MARRTKILVLTNEAEARLLEATLTERGIPHFLKSYHDSAYDGLWQTQLGWGQVDAPAEYREQIEAIVADLRTAERAEEADDAPRP